VNADLNSFLSENLPATLREKKHLGKKEAISLERKIPT